MRTPSTDPSVRYGVRDVDVDGGTLRVGIWEPVEPAASPLVTVLAIHGITANHRCWPMLSQALPELRIIAPDLRGRGRSNGLPGPYGMAVHADDLARVLQATGTAAAVVVGHSMGAFVSVVLADRHPDSVRSLVLVDGGLPLAPPPGADDEPRLQDILGPAAQRLSMTFADHADYRAFWRRHPALSRDWNQTVIDYVDYDLCGTEPEFRPCTSFAAVAADSRDLATGAALPGALERLRHPTRMLFAPRGLLNELPPLYPEASIEPWRKKLPRVELSTVRDVNHYTIVMSERGIGPIATAIREALD